MHKKITGSDKEGQCRGKQKKKLMSDYRVFKDHDSLEWVEL